MTFYTMSAAEKQKWANICPTSRRSGARDMEAQGHPGWKIVNRFIALSKSYGHVFPREWGQQK